MPAASASSVYGGALIMIKHSQIANMIAIADYRKTGNDANCWISQIASMDDADDKNGGPNFLRAWMLYRGIKGADLAKALGGAVTPGMVSDLANSKRALSAKWLRRLAPHFQTTPGMLLDHDPRELDADIIDLWSNADVRQKRQLVDIAKTLARTGTEG